MDGVLQAERQALLSAQIDGLLVRLSAVFRLFSTVFHLFRLFH